MYGQQCVICQDGEVKLNLEGMCEECSAMLSELDLPVEQELPQEEQDRLEVEYEEDGYGY